MYVFGLKLKELDLMLEDVFFYVGMKDAMTEEVLLLIFNLLECIFPSVCYVFLLMRTRKRVSAATFPFYFRGTGLD